jgi:outer membrane protein assembly factor BamB
MKSIVILFLGLFCFQSCEMKSEDIAQGTSETTHPFNPIDTILGDKVLSLDPNEFRYDNFNSLVDLDEDYLNWDSDLYEIEKLNDTLFIMRQKKTYTDARTFGIILKPSNGKIESYYVLNDFEIIDVEIEPNHCLILASDFFIYSEHWKSEQQVKIIKLDDDFNEIWTFNLNVYKPLNGRSLSINNDKFYATIDVITGCHMCSVQVEFEFSRDGELLSYKQTGKENSDWLSEIQLEDIFSSLERK